jgi:CRISPR-associated protein Cmr1
MSRTPPTQQPPKLKVRANDIITEVREYAVITPLFGGGVDPATADPISVVRASEVRGQLRFWWRATRGGQFGDNLNALRAAEEAIWGGPAREENDKPAGGQSRVQVVLQSEGLTRGSPDVPFEVHGKRVEPRQGSRVPPYAAFPLQPDRAAIDARTPIKPVLTGVRFTLAITFPREYEKDVAAALWAWETFGGIGARTRRGFGALRLLSVNGQPPADLPPADPHQFGQWLQANLKRHIAAGTWPTDVPHLVHALRFALKTGNGATAIWKELIERLQKFCQQRRANDGTLNRYGHSDWPEPNAIRILFGRPPRGPHAQRRIIKFPRAYFGLPIVFHMYHDPGLDVTLEGQDAKRARLASPLILKPVACRDDEAIGLAAILEGVRLPEPLVLKKDNQPTVQAKLTTAEARQIPPLNGQPDVLQAFLNTL